MPALLPVTGPDEPVVVATVAEAASRLGAAPDDLSWLPYAGGGAVVMRQSTQMDDEAELNTRAAFLLERTLGGRIAVRGDVLVFPDGLPWTSD